MIDAGRAFGRHQLWRRIEDGKLPKSALGAFAVQFFLQVREFPRAVSALHSSCPDAHERVELAESLYEEETGRISGCNVSHPELFIRFGEGVGLARAALVDAVPLPARSEEHTSELQSHVNLVCRLLLEKKKKKRDKIRWYNRLE